jgi:solute carrier family 35 protein F1/2
MTAAQVITILPLLFAVTCVLHPSNTPFLASNRLLGDVLAICGSILYGISNVAEEHVVKSGSSVEFLGMLGLGGAMISGIQM